jgi:hypothetical protein
MENMKMESIKRIEESQMIKYEDMIKKSKSSNGIM